MIGRFLLIGLISQGSAMAGWVEPQADGEIPALLERLRSDRAEEREESAKQLAAKGDRAIEALEKAVKSSDAELANRAKAVLAAIRSEQGGRTLARIEKTLAGAKQARVTATIKGSLKSPGVEPFEGSAAFQLLAGGGVDWTVKGNGPINAVRLTSDGKTMTAIRPADRPYGAPSPKGLPAALSSIVVPLGPILSSFMIGPLFQRAKDEPEAPFDPAAFFRCSEFVEKDGEGGRRSLKFKVDLKFLAQTDYDGSYEMTVVFDPKTFILFERKVTGSIATTQIEGHEIYTSFELDSPNR